jgi:hypothetical protein
MSAYSVEEANAPSWCTTPQFDAVYWMTSPADNGNGSSDAQCWALLQIAKDGQYQGGVGYTNYTYDSDCRVVVSESTLTTLTGYQNYRNTTYDADGNIATLSMAYTYNQGDTWLYSNMTNSYTGDLLTQSALESEYSSGYFTYTNYTYDADGRVIVSETMGATYQNTTYDTDGNIATLSTARTTQQDIWWWDNITNSYTGDLLTQSVTESACTQCESGGISMITNYTYDADGRVIVQKAAINTEIDYQNTTYDADGNIATLSTAVTLDLGDNWTRTNTTYLWGEP